MQVYMCAITETPVDVVTTTVGHVMLNEELAQVKLGEREDIGDEVWYLDTGASNHMTGACKIFSELDTGRRNSVKFDDGSILDIQGRGIVVFMGQGGEHCALTNVYFIPRLKSNIISISQLDENGCSTFMKDGLLQTVQAMRSNASKQVLKSSASAS